MSRTLRATALSVALTALALTPAALVTNLALADAALAKGGSDGEGNGGGNGNGNSGGNGGGNGNGNSAAAKSGGGSDNATGQGASNPAATQSATKKVKPKAAKAEEVAVQEPMDEPVEEDVAGKTHGKGSVASELKWMNAAHASLNAYENASPNSRVGQIATYRAALLDSQAAAEDPEYQQQQDDYRAALTAFAVEGTTPEQIDAALAAIEALDDSGEPYTQDDIDAILATLNPDAFAAPEEEPVEETEVTDGEVPVGDPAVVDPADEEVAGAEDPAEADPVADVQTALAGAVESNNMIVELAMAAADAFAIVTDGLVIEEGSDAWNAFHRLLRLDQPLPSAAEDSAEVLDPAAEEPVAVEETVALE